MAAASKRKELSHFDPRGSARMVNVSQKDPSHRRAVAEARVRISSELAERIRDNSLTKGNLLEVARLAGIQAAQKTAVLIPLCHNLPLEHADVQASLQGNSVQLRAEIVTFGKTGVEMEALTAVSIAALTVIDMGKAVDRAMVIESVQLLEKSGGASGDYLAPHVALERNDHGVPISAAVLTVSDRCSRGETDDTSGPALVELLAEQLGASVVATDCVPDDVEAIRTRLLAWAVEEPKPDLILTTGGTGLAPRDVTPEATAAVLERRHSGLLELVRRRCASKTPRVFLSRGEAGAIGKTLVLNLPGSTTGAVESLQALIDVLPHAVEVLRGEVQDEGRPEAPAVTGKVIRHEK